MEGKWIDVGSIGDFESGKLHPLKVEDKNIVIFNNVTGWFAFQGKCPHQGRPLVDGKVKKTILECAYHAVAFDIKTGKVVRDGGYLDMPDLEVYPLDIEDDRIRIMLEPGN